MKKVPMFAVLAICAVLGCFALVRRDARAREAREEKMRDAVLVQIREHAGEELDHALLAGRVDLSVDQLFDLLMTLERSGRIQAIPKDPRRKPILLNRRDKELYYWKVTVATDGI